MMRSQQQSLAFARRRSIAAIASLGLAVATMLATAPSATAAAGSTDLITNGGFETGDFSGWTDVSSGSGAWYINDGTYDPAGPGDATAPISGDFDVVSAQGGPGLHLLTQDLAVPDDISSATLAWSDRIRNHAADYSDPNQEFRVELLDASGAVVQEVFSTDPGDDLQQLGPNVRSFDVTAALQSLEGSTVQVSFEEQDDQLFFNVNVDDVSLVIERRPDTKADCKKDGWKSYGVFKNQGDCVSFVATGGKNGAANG